MAKQVVTLRLEEDTVAWLDEYAASRSIDGQPAVSRTLIIELAIKELRGLAAGGVPELPTRTPTHRPSSRRRRCWRCARCVTRVFLTDEPEEYVPVCPDHGPMVRDSNRPYAGQEVVQ